MLGGTNQTEIPARNRHAAAAICLAVAALLSPASAFAHTSEQAFVLLLPTSLYTAAGVSVVALTIIVISALPHGAARTIFASVTLGAQPRIGLENATSLLSTVLLAFLLWTGFSGPRNPLENLLPLTVWTLWWMGFICLQAVFGDLWHWLNPWTGIYRLLAPLWGGRTFLPLPARLGDWPGVAAFFVFVCFMLADIAPDDPARLAWAVAVYWLFTFFGMILFGSDVWLARAECLTMILRRYAQLAVFARERNRLRAGLPGWRLANAEPASHAGAVLVICILGTGSFDGLNETFWWLAWIGINPLEFPGRSAVVIPTIAGVLAANLALVLLFAIVVGTGLRMAGTGASFREAFGLLALAILPIALGYHVAHYLTAFLVQAQYAAAALTDPFATGADLLGLGNFYVTTGFFNTRDTVEIIWLSQAGAVVLGHVLSVLVGHAQATRLFAARRQAFASQIPLALFMILYTLFGLWLLATPRGA